MVIKESYTLTATNTDIFAAPSRLASIPANGTLTLEMSSTDADGTNFFQVTLQTPEGDVPFENLHVPYNGRSGTEDTMDDANKLTFQMRARQGGHFLLSCAENGTSRLFLIATLTF